MMGRKYNCLKIGQNWRLSTKYNFQANTNSKKGNSLRQNWEIFLLSSSYMHRVTHGKKEMVLIVPGNHIRTTLKILWTKKDLKKSLTIFSAKNNFHSTTKQEDRQKSGIFFLNLLTRAPTQTRVPNNKRQPNIYSLNRNSKY